MVLATNRKTTVYRTNGRDVPTLARRVVKAVSQHGGRADYAAVTHTFGSDSDDGGLDQYQTTVRLP